MLPKATEEFKECDFLCAAENTKRPILFTLRKIFEKEKCNGEFFLQKLFVKIYWLCETYEWFFKFSCR